MQKSTPMCKSDYDKKINTQMNRTVTTPNSGAMPHITTPPPTGMPMDISTPPNTGIPINRGTPINRGGTPGVPMNGPVQQPIRTPMNGTMPRPGTRPINGMPMNGTMPMPSTMPINGMPMNGTMPMPGTRPINGMPMNGTMPMPGTMPPAAQMPMNGMYMNGNASIPNNTPYNTPMGVPLYPLYGYDNSEDLDRDMNYLKQLYPSSARRIQMEINTECDKLEYDGSVMFDEYPDKVSLDRIIDQVYERINDMDEDTMLEAKSVYYAPRRRQNVLRDFVSIILLNELFNRRRRYRSRRRWF